MSNLEMTIEDGQVGFKAKDDARKEFRALFDLGKTIGISIVILVILALVLRATETIITTKLIIPEAQAATIASVRDEYQTKLLLRTDKSITLAPGEIKLYTLGFKNTGTASWQNSGDNFLSIYTVDPNYRESKFYDPSWRQTSQPVIMKDKNVPPGMVGFFEFNLQAPKTTGTYTESFHVAAEDLLWLPGGGFEIEIKVQESKTEKKEAVTVPVITPVSTSSNTSSVPVAETSNKSTDGYNATLLLRSHKQEVKLGPNETVNMIVAFKNSGTETWKNRSLRAGEVVIATTAPSFHHLSWAGSNEVVKVTDEIKPGALAYFNFTLQTPNKKGSYAPIFRIAVNDDLTVPGGEIQIPITVTADGESSSVSESLPIVEIISEPIIRVGLFTTERPIMITANGDYDILETGSVVQTVRSGQLSKIIFDFNYHTCTVANSNGTNVYHEPLRFVTKDQAAGVFTIPSYEHPTGWNKSLNDNQFRQTLEIYYVENTGNLWVINELPMEKYLDGLAETSNPTDPKFQKALAAAARTYAFYHWSRNTKHGGHFQVDATYDQVYRGYGSEIRMPQWVQSIEESRGAIVTYGGEIALTPYYSRSDGRTRSWEEVWGGGPKAWLKSVPTPYDAGQTLWGHGVGMSARDALLRARAGTPWQDIVKYYYTGVDIVQKWQ